MTHSYFATFALLIGCTQPAGDEAKLPDADADTDSDSDTDTDSDTDSDGVIFPEDCVGPC